MCIALITTAHPSYALIVLDNRDEFIRQPTTRPHWWSSHGEDVLSSRDLQRAERGTWLGVSETGKLAVVTNYHESNPNKTKCSKQKQKSRGAVVTSWLTSPEQESTAIFVEKLLDDEGMKDASGFSLICGTLRKQADADRQKLEPLAVVSNRYKGHQDVHWIANKREEIYGLSNASYADPVKWPKISRGETLLSNAVDEAIANTWDEERLVEKLYTVLDTNTLPHRKGYSYEEYIYQLRNSIFIPPIGGREAYLQLSKEYLYQLRKSIYIPSISSVKAGDSRLKPKDVARLIVAGWQSLVNGHLRRHPTQMDELERKKKPISGRMLGYYGTQRQTILLVDWNGNVTFRERALWDDCGNPVARGKGDVKYEFKIKGWHG